MQGTLSEIDIRSILQLIELGQRTGYLEVEAFGGENATRTLGSIGSSRDLKTRSQEQFWIVFFLNGQIAYAANGDNSLSRLRDYVRRYKVDAALDNVSVPSIATLNAPEYGYLWNLLETHIVTPAQGRSIIQSMVRETLFDLLGLRNGSFIFEIGPALEPQLTTLEIGPLVTHIMKQVQEWKQFHPHIQSPDQCPIIVDTAQLRQKLPENTFKILEHWADGKTSIRQMARYLNREILPVARAIYPYIQQGWVQLLYPTTGATASNRELTSYPETGVPRIVFIDDGIATCKAVEYTLKQYGYAVAAINNPLKALSLVFQIKPDLILCDIAMPDLDGFEICAMLRRSTAFRQTPIVMLTGKDGFIDRVKARMVGATDYLTKPFGDSELLMLVEKYVGPCNPNLSQKTQLSLDALEEEIAEIDPSTAKP
ncbi:response regulator [Argonema antarcticum]|uniref:response regulator n=1 Tax=Argonema antarcticum TaxID=2942763 RepID=UPI0020117A60|nr:response regulator [Argonema antarcticum]MCL1474808.1 response regulator [Argonema antarcticum A004/B2]